MAHVRATAWLLICMEADLSRAPPGDRLVCLVALHVCFTGMRRHRRSTRVRRRTGPGQYDVRARVERFGERVDMGNLYRFFRLLEAEGLVRSEWDDEAPGPSKRIYELTDEGRALLDQWASALGDAQARIEGFLTRHGERR